MPHAFFNGATYPVYTDATITVYPDPDTEATSVDGSTEFVESSSWATTRNAGDATIAEDDVTEMQGRTRIQGSGNRSTWRSFILFDTSAIDENDQVDQASIHLKAYTTVDEDNDANGYIAIVKTDPASNTAITSADYDRIQDVNGTTPFVSGVAFKSFLDAGRHHVRRNRYLYLLYS